MTKSKWTSWRGLPDLASFQLILTVQVGWPPTYKKVVWPKKSAEFRLNLIIHLFGWKSGTPGNPAYDWTAERDHGIAYRPLTSPWMMPHTLMLLWMSVISGEIERGKRKGKRVKRKKRKKERMNQREIKKSMTKGFSKPPFVIPENYWDFSTI